MKTIQMATPTRKWYDTNEYKKSQAVALWIKHLRNNKIILDETREVFLNTFHVLPNVWEDYQDDFIVGMSIELEHGTEGGDITNVTDDDLLMTAQITFRFSQKRDISFLIIS